MLYSVTIVRPDGHRVHADFQLYDEETPEVGKTINVMCDNLVTRARVARIISHPLVDQVVADEF